MNESVVEGVRALMDEDKSGRHAKSDDADDDGPDERPIEKRDAAVERVKKHAEKRSEPKHRHAELWKQTANQVIRRRTSKRSRSSRPASSR